MLWQYSNFGCDHWFFLKRLFKFSSCCKEIRTSNPHQKQSLHHLQPLPKCWISFSPRVYTHIHHLCSVPEDREHNMTPPRAPGDGEQEAKGRNRQTEGKAERRAKQTQTERRLESEPQTASPPLSITIIIASASALAHCHHVNTPHCTLITGPQRLPHK